MWGACAVVPVLVRIWPLACHPSWGGAIGGVAGTKQYLPEVTEVDLDLDLPHTAARDVVSASWSPD